MSATPELTFSDVVSKLFIYKWRIIIITVATTLIGVAYVLSLPRGYTAITKIVVERKAGQSISSSMGALGGLLGAANLEDDGITINLASSIVQSIPFILDFENIEIELLNPKNDTPKRLTLSDYLIYNQYTPWWSFSSGATNKENVKDTVKSKYILSASQETFIKATKSMFSVATDKKTNVITLSATTQDPMVSVILVDSLAATLQKYITTYQVSKANQELEQALKIAEITRARYYICQEDYAKSKDRNQNLIMSGAQAKIDRLKNDMDIALQAYTAAASQVEVAHTKVWENTPVYTVLDPPLLDKSASYPNRKLVAAVSLLFGLFIGVGSVIAPDIKNSILPKKTK